MKTRQPGAPAFPPGEPGHQRPDTAGAPAGAVPDDQPARHSPQRQQPEQQPPEQKSPEQQPPAPKPTRRPWGARRVAAAVTAFLIMIAAGALLFEAVWTRTGHHANAWW